MSKSLFDDLFQDSSFDNNNKNATQLKKQKSTDDFDDDWFDSDIPTKKSTTTSNIKRQDDGINDDDQDDRWNRTTGSNASYIPSFGGGGTMTNTFSTQGPDTLQRIISQPRPATASRPRIFDEPIDNPISKPTTSSIDADKSKKVVRFDGFDLTRPSTAPSPSGTVQNRPSTGGLSAMRTGLEPNKFSDSSANFKSTTESNKTKNWLESQLASSDEDEIPPRPTQNYEPVVTTIVKKNPIAPTQQSSTAISESSKKSFLDSHLEDERRILSEKTPLPPPAPTNSTKQDFLFDDRTTSNKRPSVNGPSIPSLFSDQPSTKSTIKSSFETKDDLGDVIFSTDRPILSTSTRNNSSSVNLDIKRFEFENNELKMTIDHMKRQHETEINMLEEGYKHRLDYMEKSCERRETRLKEENEHLLRQLNDRIQQYEKEKSTLIIDHQRRLDDLQRDRTNELENLRTLQRQTLDHLRHEHEQTIQRLKQLKQQEISTALDVTTHTRAFEAVVDQMEHNAKNIDELRLKIEAKHGSTITDKQIEARAKEQQLKAYEERLQMQTADFERERKNLQELISRLEVHLSDQTKLVEEERWKALQSQKRMEAMQDALNGEQRLFMEKLTRDRADIQRSKDQLLEDQKIALATIYESRSQLADERAKVEALQKTFQEQKHRDMLQNATIEAETRAQQKLVSEQITRLEKREQELIKREEALLLEKRSLTELKQRLDIEQATLKNQKDEYEQKLQDIEHANQSIKKDKERLSQLYYELHALDSKNTDRLQQLQKSLSTLRHQEEHMNEQYSRMTNERETLNHLRSSVSYKNSTPLIDSGFSTSQLTIATPLLPINSTQQSIDENAIIRTLRRNDLEDQLYIQSEMSFLQNLRAGNPLTLRSTSLSNLPRHSDSNLLKTYH